VYPFRAEEMVGAARFELATPSPPDWCANRAALRSEGRQNRGEAEFALVSPFMQMAVALVGAAALDDVEALSQLRLIVATGDTRTSAPPSVE
jgi:hypothetical protein